MPSRATSSRTRKTPRVSPYFVRRLSSWLVLTTALTLGAAKVAHASSTIYWDSDGTAVNNSTLGTGTGLGGTGSWDPFTPLWWNGVSGSDQTWVNGNFDTAVFAGTAGTVNAGSINAGGLVFNTTGYTLSGSEVSLGGSSTPFITVANGDTATISASLFNSNGLGVAVNGLGTLILSGIGNSFGGGVGLDIQSGTVVAATNSALGANEITLGSTSGNTAASLLVSVGGSSFNGPIVLATGGTGTLTVGNTGTAISTTFTSVVTGTNNLTISENATTGSVTFAGGGSGGINIAGTVTNTGAGTGTTAISFIGGNVTGVNEYSASSPITIGTLALNGARR